MKQLIVLILLLLPALTFAAEVDLQSANIDSQDVAAQKRGFKAFQTYCASCHSTHFQRYQRVADDLGLTEDELKQYMFTGAQESDLIERTMTDEDATRWFGMAPPDLTLVSRVRGEDWVYSFLKSFYQDDKRPFGVNNLLMPYTSMPHVLQYEQGLALPTLAQQQKNGRTITKVVGISDPQGGSMSAPEYDALVKDITAYLVYAAEPVKAQREQMGRWVLLYLAVFFLLAWLLKKEYWKDVH
ncbi:cytochrome c1 [Shewanella avicenniae]|uniref:Cytochrome c1 n=1 Tax=Shewanella avicenniae TaxID=2814294 RepID=A0ABX7QSB4_9GAMM|nr:cytochrome c1 [Shewanella avicenniae]QSX34338.1 cytochrome c1 [Shewanella avicenniae]